jgi:multidrug efflux pump subunit AcrA (membrane-fusion protein)
MRIGLWVLLAVVLAGGAGVVIAMNGRQTVGRADDVPVSVVKRGALAIEVHGTGELNANNSVMLSAPAMGGDALQITRLAQTGERVKKGDVVVEFDPSEQNYKLEQNRSELMQADEEIIKAKADTEVQTSEDKVALLKARYDVRRAELDVEKNELVSKIDGQKNDLALEQAKRVLAQLEKDIESHKASGNATIYLAQEKHNKAQLAMNLAQQNLEHMRVMAPMDGLVSIEKNQNAAGGFYFTGMTLPDYRAGDTVRPGSAIVQVLDPSGMNLVSKVPEDEHDNIRTGQVVKVTFHAIPDHVFEGSVKSVGGMSMGSIFNSDPNSHTFDATIQLKGGDARLRPGLTADLMFEGVQATNVLYVPRQALFMKDGKRVVFVRKGGSYQQHEVKIKSASESQAAVDGLEEGTTIALIDPTIPHKQSGSGSAASVEGAP